MHALQDSIFLLWKKENLGSLMHKGKILMTVNENFKIYKDLYNEKPFKSH